MICEFGMSNGMGPWRIKRWTGPPRGRFRSGEWRKTQRQNRGRGAGHTHARLRPRREREPQRTVLDGMAEVQCAGTSARGFLAHSDADKISSHMRCRSRAIGLRCPIPARPYRQRRAVTKGEYLVAQCRVGSPRNSMPRGVLPSDGGCGIGPAGVLTPRTSPGCSSCSLLEFTLLSFCFANGPDERDIHYPTSDRHQYGGKGVPRSASIHRSPMGTPRALGRTGTTACSSA